jgi:ATP-dependent Clp protease adaptor protein ClpS
MNPFPMASQTEVDFAPAIDVVEIEAIVNDLVVFNDEVNTFDHVIQALIDICQHTAEQAEQCTIIIHYKGKCTVRSGAFEELVPMRNAICKRGISAEVL